MLPILLALGILAILFIVIVAGQPDDFAMSRSARFAVAPEKVFPHINNLHHWQAWSPWAKLDPNAKNSFTGPDAGSGAAMAWEGNCKVGVGKMTVTDSQPNSIIRFRLDFQKPMQATHTAEFNLLPDAGGTVITWSMSGKNNLMGKIMGLFMNCEKMVAGQFDQGLANLKAIVEGD
ncbi:MAG: hypothetical protein RLY20_3540 [Verrucomicrobiota bacterium]|jgi:hypothetical protein